MPPSESMVGPRNDCGPHRVSRVFTMTTATLPGRLMRPIASTALRRSALTGFLATIALGLVGLIGTSAAIGVANADRALAGVTVGGVDIAGLDRAAARERLVERLPSVSSGEAVIVADGTERVVEFGALGRAYDLEAMLDAAFGAGRDAGPVADGIERLRSLVHPTRVDVVVRPFDEDRLQRAAAQVAASVTTHPVQAYVDRITFDVHPSSPGRVLEADAVRDALATSLATTSPADVQLTLTTTVVEPVIVTAEAEAAAEAARATAVDLTLTIPGAPVDADPITLAADRIAAWIRFGPAEGADYAMHVDGAAVATAVAGLAGDVDQDPVNAGFGVAGAGLGGVIPGADGRVLEVEASSAELLTLLEGRSIGTESNSMALQVDVTEPALTTVEAQALLPQMRMVSSWTTNYVPNDGNGYGANISIGAWDIDGMNVAPGEWVSFWDAIGPVTLERGYTYGGAIINGRSVANGALAGGICSTSTTLFNAAMRAGLEIGDRLAHFYYIDRYPVGLDATVSIFDDWVTDMTFRNDTEHPIVIRGFGTPGKVTFQIWSVPTGRTVALSDPIISNRKSAIETTQVDTSLAPGTSRRVEYPHHGFQTTVNRTVYAADGTVLHQNSWFSDYRAVNGVTLVGPTAAAPPADTDSGATAAAPPGEEPPAEDN